VLLGALCLYRCTGSWPGRGPKSNTWLDSWPFARCEPEGLADDVLSTSRTLDVARVENVSVQRM
jgi:hypothetical protein